jgi:hypothetical protein
LETDGSWMDPTQTTHRFAGFFKSCVDIYAFININHRNERNILSNDDRNKTKAFE